MMFKYIDKGELNKLLRLFNSKGSSCPVMNVKDIRGYTLLTFCAFKDDILAMKIIYEHVKSTNEDEADPAAISNWANQ